MHETYGFTDEGAGWKSLSHAWLQSRLWRSLWFKSNQITCSLPSQSTIPLWEKKNCVNLSLQGISGKNLTAAWSFKERSLLLRPPWHSSLSDDAFIAHFMSLWKCILVCVCAGFPLGLQCGGGSNLSRLSPGEETIADGQKHPWHYLLSECFDINTDFYTDLRRAYV